MIQVVPRNDAKFDGCTNPRISILVIEAIFRLPHAGEEAVSIPAEYHKGRICPLIHNQVI